MRFFKNRRLPQIVILLLILVITPLSAEAKKRFGEFKRGAGSIEFTHYKPFKKQPINLLYYIPTKGNVRNMQVIISMPGSQRVGKTQIDAWEPLAEKHGFVVLVPEMMQNKGYRKNSYRFGFVSRSLKNGEFKLRPRQKWTFQLIEEIFDYYVSETNSKVKQYDLFGQSAGAQFVERFVMTMHDARYRRAIASNAGQYTYPDPSGLHHPDGTLCDHPGWPHSVSDTPFANKEHLRKVFKRDFVIHIGTKDRQDLLVRDKLTDTIGGTKFKYNFFHIMGATRYDRAHHFYNYSKRIAEELGLEFNWRLVENIGVGHGATGAIYGRANVPKITKKDGTMTYDINAATDHSVFHLLIDENHTKKRSRKQK